MKLQLDPYEALVEVNRLRSVLFRIRAQFGAGFRSHHDRNEAVAQWKFAREQYISATAQWAAATDEQQTEILAISQERANKLSSKMQPLNERYLDAARCSPEEAASFAHRESLSARQAEIESACSSVGGARAAMIRAKEQLESAQKTSVDPLVTPIHIG